MRCELSEKVSQFLDGELSVEEAERFKEHMVACDACRQTYEEFLQIRREIKEYDFKLEPQQAQQALREILNRQRAPFWKEKVAVPVPALAMLLIAFIALAVWAVAFRKPSPVEGAKVRHAPPETAQPSRGHFDLSSFDEGGRAAIIKIKRGEANAAAQ